MYLVTGDDHNRPVLVLGPNHRADMDIYMQKLPSLLYPDTSDCTAQLSAAWYRDLRGPEVWRDDWCVSSLAPSPLHLRHQARPPYRHPDTGISASLTTLLLTHGQLFLSILADWFCSHLLKGLLLPQSPVLWFLSVSPFLSLLSPSYSWQILQDWGKMLAFADIMRYSRFCFLFMQGIDSSRGIISSRNIYLFKKIVLFGSWSSQTAILQTRLFFHHHLHHPTNLLGPRLRECLKDSRKLHSDYGRNYCLSIPLFLSSRCRNF